MTPEALIEKVEDLSVPAPTVVKLLSLLNQDDIDNQAVVGVVRTDAVLSAKLLALSNSAFFAPPSPIESCDEALFYLGYEQVYQMAVALGLSGLLNRKASNYAMDEGDFWRHSLLTAKACELIATTMPHLTNPSIGFTTGLLHDIGKLVLNQVLAAEPQAAVQKTIQERGSAGVVAEKAILGTNHAEVGALLLKKWSLPAEIVEAVRNHHTIQPGNEVKLSLLVELADSIAHTAASTRGSVTPEVLRTLLRRLGIDQAKYEEILGETAEALAHIEAIGEVARD